MTTAAHASIVAHTRAQLQHREAQTEAQLTAAHTQAVHALTPMLNTLYKAIGAMQQSGTQSGLAWLYSFGNLRAIQRAVHEHISTFAEFARKNAIPLHQDAIAIGTASAHAQLQTVTPTPNVLHPTYMAARAGLQILHNSNLYATFAPQAAQDVTSAITTGVSLGSPVRQIAANVAAALNKSLQRALVIAGEAMTSVFRGVTHATMQANSGVAAGWIWVADLDGTPSPCIACILMHGTKHKLSEDMKSHLRCRCVQIPYFADNPDIAGQSGTDWFLSQDAATQQEIMGNGRYKYWKSGAFSLMDMLGTEPDGTVYVKSLKELGVH